MPAFGRLFYGSEVRFGSVTVLVELQSLRLRQSKLGLNFGKFQLNCEFPPESAIALNLSYRIEISH